MMKFYTTALQNTLPNPANMQRRPTEDGNSCALCSFGPATARHICIGCPKALDENT